MPLSVCLSQGISPLLLFNFVIKWRSKGRRLGGEQHIIIMVESFFSLLPFSVTPSLPIIVVLVIFLILPEKLISMGLDGPMKQVGYIFYK